VQFSVQFNPANAAAEARSRRSGDVHGHCEVIVAGHGQSVSGGRVRPVAQVLARQEHVDLAERRPTTVVDVPALDEQVEDLSRADARLRQTRRRAVTAAAASSSSAAGVEVDQLGEQMRVGECVVRTTTSET